MKLPCLCMLLIYLLHLSGATKQTCPKSASSCDQCIQSGPECVWCSAPHADIRCHTLKGLQRSHCDKSYIYNPQGEVQVVRNESSTDPAEDKTLILQPQELSFFLRSGVSQSFPLTISMPTEQPITELILDTSNVPEVLNITFSSIMKGTPPSIQVTVEAAQCPSKKDSSNQNKTGPWSVHIRPRGFSLSVKLEITLQCECNCTGNREENSPACSNSGALVCGQCECYQSYAGNRCQMISDSFWSRDERFCRSGENAPLCSGRGKCVEGFCECERRANPQERYSGEYCECSNFDCPRYRNRMCSGHGRCECGSCVCDDDWIGEDCGCSMDTASCMASNQMVCNGRGNCECGACRCDPPYLGQTCEFCPTCTSPCEEHAACVECRAFGTGEKMNTCDTQCDYLTVNVVKHNGFPPASKTNRLCRMRTHHGDCFFYFTVPSGGRSTVAKEC